jgi:AraC-like DNA-binding protein
MVEIFQNIRQLYDFATPCEELARYIEFFAESSPARTQQYAGHATFTVTMFASWTPTFYINLGAPYLIDLAQTRYRVNAQDSILILRDQAVARHNLPTDNVFTVKFHPGGLEAVLGIRQVGLANQIVQLPPLLPARLLAQLRQPVTFGERVALLERYFLAASRPKGQDHYLAMVSDAIGEYQAAGLQLNTSAVAERLFMTSKTINRYFHRVVGTSPKHYFSVLRARTALTAFVANRAEFVPFEYGYYDRSHFDKDIRKFTGHQPTTLNFKR